MMRTLSFKLILLALLLGSQVYAQDLSLTDYKTFIQKNFPEFLEHFNVSSLSNFATRGIDSIAFEETSMTTQKYNAKEWDDYTQLYQPFIEYNPTKAYFVDLISGGIGIEYRDGKYYGEGDVDQEVKLGIVATQTTYRLAFSGPSGGYCEAKWVNNDVLIVVGYFDESYLQFTPNIQIYDFKNKVTS